MFLLFNTVPSDPEIINSFLTTQLLSSELNIHTSIELQSFSLVIELHLLPSNSHITCVSEFNSDIKIFMFSCSAVASSSWVESVVEVLLF